MPWTDEYSVPIARALAQHGVTGAAIFEHRPDRDSPGMHFVRCKPEPGAEWTYYRVRPSVSVSDRGEVGRANHLAAEALGA